LLCDQLRKLGSGTIVFSHFNNVLRTHSKTMPTV
jgi:hypothetical protein